MYDWVRAAAVQIKDCFSEMAHPTRSLTPFERDLFAYFNEYKQYDAVRYVVIMSAERKLPTGKSYFLHHLRDDHNFIHRLAVYKANGFNIAAIFRTDKPLHEQWPYPEAGWIKDPKDFERPLYNLHWDDRQLEPVRARTEDGARYVPPSYIKGVVIGGGA